MNDKTFFIDVGLKNEKYGNGSSDVSDPELKKINSLTRNGPLKKLTKDDVQTRSLLIMGEEPTSKMSVHPQAIAGKKPKVLDKLVNLLPGSPMMVGHQMDKTPWGRTFDAEVLNGVPKYQGGVVKESFWFLNDDEGQSISRKIDAGIWSEGSISYLFTEARCSICHKPIANWLNMSSCKHEIGKKYNGVVCYWYPYGIKKVAETSYVYAGAYGKTKSMLNSENDELVMYDRTQIESGRELETQLQDHGLNLNFESENTNETYSDEHDGDQNSSNESTENSGENSDKSGTVDCSPKKIEDGIENSELNGEKSGTATDKIVNPTENVDSNKEDNSGNDNSNTDSSSTDSQHSNNGDSGRQSGTSSEQSKEQNKKEGIGNSTGRNQNANSESEGVSETTKTEGASGNENSDSKGGQEGKEKTTKNAGTSDKGIPGNKNDGAAQSDGKSIVNVSRNENSNNETQVSINTNNNETLLNTEDNIASAENVGDSTETTVKDGDSARNSQSEGGDGAERAQPDHNKTDNSEALTKEGVLHLCNGLVDTPCGEEVLKVLNDDSLDKDEKESALIELLSDNAANLDRIDEMLNFQLAQPEGSHEVEVYEVTCPCCGYLEDTDSKTEVNSLSVCEGCGSELTIKRSQKLSLSSPVGSIEPQKSGKVLNEFIDLDSFRTLPEGTYFIEPAYDGVWIEIHRDGDKIELFNEDTEEYSEKFPGIVAEISKLSIDKFVIVGQMVKYRGNKRLTHESVSSWMDSKQESYDDKHFRFKPFDMPIVNGEDISNEQLKNRREKMDIGIKWGKQINPTKFHTVTHKTGGASLILSINDRRTREGAIVRNVDSLYLKKDANKLYSWIQHREINCKVTAVEKSDNDMFVYDCEIGRGKNVKPIGKTFSTKIIAEENSIIRVSVDYITYNESVDELSWIAPKVVANRAYGKQADLVSVLEQFAVPKDSIDKASGVADATDTKTKCANSFVIHHHGWGKKEHFDIRFGSPKSECLFGFTCFNEPTKDAGGKKVRCLEKENHDVKWLDINTDEIKPGEDGNPTTNFNAYMINKDSGSYEFVCRKSGFLEVVLNGEEYKGRYVFRCIDVSARKDDNKIVGDEVGTKNDKVWLMWKAKDQTVKAKMNKLDYSFTGGCLTFWESEVSDNKLDMLSELDWEEKPTRED